MKRLSDLAHEDGPIYNRFKLVLKEWKEGYEKRNQSGDINVIKFLEYFGEFDNES